MYDYTHTQKEWLKKATSEEKKQFLSKGPATFDTGICNKTTYVPMIRGHRFKEAFDTSDEATKAAEKILRCLQDSIKGHPPLNEHALGIDGQNAIYLRQCAENSLRISGILHLASILGSNELTMSFHDLIGDLLDHLFDQTSHHDSIVPLIPEIDPKDRDLENEIVHDHWLKNGFYGFAVLAITPTLHDGVSYGWAVCRQQWFYAETYAQAFNLALEWSKKEAV